MLLQSSILHRVLAEGRPLTRVHLREVLLDHFALPQREENGHCSPDAIAPVGTVREVSPVAQATGISSGRRFRDERRRARVRLPRLVEVDLQENRRRDRGIQDRPIRSHDPKSVVGLPKERQRIVD